MKCGKPALLGLVEHQKDDVKKSLEEVKHSQPFFSIFGTLQHHPQPRTVGAWGLSGVTSALGLCSGGI